MLRNLFGIDLGTSGLILQAQSREETLADKIIARSEHAEVSASASRASLRNSSGTPS
jgi:hypothetical protein